MCHIISKLLLALCFLLELEHLWNFQSVHRETRMNLFIARLIFSSFSLFFDLFHHTEPHILLSRPSSLTSSMDRLRSAFNRVVSVKTVKLFEQEHVALIVSTPHLSSCRLRTSSTAGLPCIPQKMEKDTRRSNCLTTPPSLTIRWTGLRAFGPPRHSNTGVICVSLSWECC